MAAQRMKRAQLTQRQNEERYKINGEVEAARKLHYRRTSHYKVLNKKIAGNDWHTPANLATRKQKVKISLICN